MLIEIWYLPTCFDVCIPTQFDDQMSDDKVPVNVPFDDAEEGCELGVRLDSEGEQPQPLEQSSSEEEENDQGSSSTSASHPPQPPDHHSTSPKYFLAKSPLSEEYFFEFVSDGRNPKCSCTHLQCVNSLVVILNFSVGWCCRSNTSF